MAVLVEMVRTKILQAGRTACRGFTLLELVVVMVIIGLFAAVSVPLFYKSLATAKLKTSARVVGAVLRKAREQAVSAKVTVKTVINVSDGRFWLEGSANKKPGKGAVGAMPGDIKKRTLAEGVHFVKVVNGDKETTEGEYTFFFYPKGNSKGGTVYIQDKRTWGFKVTVEPILGKVVIGEFSEDDDEE